MPHRTRRCTVDGSSSHEEIHQEDWLIRRAIAGDEGAFRLLVEPHRPMLWRVAWRITGDRDLAYDACQDGLLAAWKNLDQFKRKRGAKFSTWLCAIVQRAALKIIRRRVAEPIGDAGDFPDAVLDGPDAGMHGELQAALMRLTPERRTAVVGRMCGFSHAEIAATLHISEGAARKLLMRARRDLEALLDLA
jgi:RNA polymerase sigma-70 factor, ECF subfamily